MGAILEALRALPIFGRIVEWVLAEWKTWCGRKHVAKAQQRKDTKDAAVDAAIADVVRLRDADDAPRQQPKVDGPS